MSKERCDGKCPWMEGERFEGAICEECGAVADGQGGVDMETSGNCGSGVNDTGSKCLPFGLYEKPSGAVAAYPIRPMSPDEVEEYMLNLDGDRLPGANEAARS